MGGRSIELAGAVVAITGGGRGIGYAAAEAFARRGARVCIGDLDGDGVANAASEIARGAEPFQVDVRSTSPLPDSCPRRRSQSGRSTCSSTTPG